MKAILVLLVLVLWSVLNAQPTSEVIKKIEDLKKNAALYEKTLDLKEAIAANKELLALARANCKNKKHLRTIEIFYNKKLGRLYNAAEQHTEALVYLYQWLNLISGMPAEEIAKCYSDIGGTYYKMLKYQEALQWYKNAKTKLKEAEKKENISPLVKSFPDYNIGLVLCSLNRFQEALNHYDLSLQLRLKSGSAEHIGITYQEIAKIYQSLNNLKKSEEKYRQAEKYLGEAYRSNPSNQLELCVARCAHNIGKICYDLGSTEQALKYYQDAFAKRKLLYKELPSLELVQSCSEIGFALASLGRYDESLKCQEEALERAEKAKNQVPHPILGSCYQGIGTVLLKQGWDAKNTKMSGYEAKYAKSFDFFTKAIEAFQIDSNAYLEIARCYSSLGIVLQQQGHYNEAFKKFDDALKTMDKVSLDPHYTKATIYHNIGSTYEDIKQYQKASEFYDKALKMFQQVYPPDHPQIANIYIRMAINDFFLGKYDKCYSDAKTSFFLRQKIFQGEWPVLSTNDKISRISSYFNSIISVMSTLISTKPCPEWVTTAFDATLYQKSLLMQVLTKEKQILQATRNPEMEKLYKKYSDTVEILNYQAYQVLPLDSQNRNIALEKLKKLRAEKNNLEQQISLKSKPFLLSLKQDEFSLKRIQQVLPQNAGLLEFVAFEHVKDKKKEIGVFVVTQNSIRFITLGDSDVIQKHISDIKRQISEYAGYIRTIGKDDFVFTKEVIDTTKDKEKKLAKKSRKLYSLIFPKTVESLLDNFSTIFLAPDDCLHYLSFGMLDRGHGEKIEYFIEKHNFVYLSSGVSLLRNYPKYGTGFYGVANPNYDLLPIQKQQLLAKELSHLGGKVTSEEEDAIMTRGPIGAKWNFLQNTEEEIANGEENYKSPQYLFSSNDDRILLNNGQIPLDWKKRFSINGHSLSGSATLTVLEKDKKWGIKDKKNRYHIVRKGDRVLVYIGEDTSVLRTKNEAMETLFVREAPGKRMIHVASHAYFLDKQETAEDNFSILQLSLFHKLALFHIPRENPLLLSGLVFAGANTFDENYKGMDDGYLLSANIALLPLEGVECMVLSCCDTGLGDYLSGVGVFSFKWACEYAGVRYLLASLWKVPNEATVNFMEYFYFYHKQYDPWNALLKAQKKYLQTHRYENSIKTHPYFWAAFICQGNPLPLQKTHLLIPESKSYSYSWPIIGFGLGILAIFSVKICFVLRKKTKTRPSPRLRRKSIVFKKHSQQ
ncbi:MAG: CHAT domain-containing protein [Candidatus Brocadiae bacterium]|nr:CHAT domain-containing protein [Candidatus Brocadiia bacterium]